jgi:hypothetical protein
MPSSTSLIQAVPVRPNPISSNPSPSSQPETNFLHFKLLQSVQNRLPSYQAIPVGPKLTSFIPSYYSQAKTVFIHLFSQLVTELFSSCLNTSDNEVKHDLNSKRAGRKEKKNRWQFCRNWYLF